MGEKKVLEHRVRLIDLQDQARMRGVFKGSGFERTQAALYLMREAWGLKWQKGQQEGGQKKQQELILKMLKEKVGLSVISRMTGLPTQEIKKLKNGS